MGKYMDPTLEDLRKEQASVRQAQKQQPQKPLAALEELGHEQALMRTAQAKREQKPLTSLEELGYKQALMREAQAKKEQKPLTAITVALAGKETNAITMAGLRQAEQRMAPGGLRIAEKNEAGLQAVQRALSKLQGGEAKRTIEDLSTIVVPYFQNPLVPFKNSAGAFPERGRNITTLNASQQLSSAGNNADNDKLQNGGNLDIGTLKLNKAISNYEQEMANENLTPDLEAGLKRALTMARNIAETNPELAYAILEYVASKGQAIEYDLNILREKQSILQAWLTDLREQSMRVLSKNSGASQEAITTIIEQQTIIDSELKKVEAQIRYMKTHGMKESEMKYPFYSM